MYPAVGPIKLVILVLYDWIGTSDLEVIWIWYHKDASFHVWAYLTSKSVICVLACHQKCNEMQPWMQHWIIDFRTSFRTMTNLNLAKNTMVTFLLESCLLADHELFTCLKVLRGIHSLLQYSCVNDVSITYLL